MRRWCRRLMSCRWYQWPLHSVATWFSSPLDRPLPMWYATATSEPQSVPCNQPLKNYYQDLFNTWICNMNELTASSWLISQLSAARRRRRRSSSSSSSSRYKHPRHYRTKSTVFIFDLLIDSGMDIDNDRIFIVDWDSGDGFTHGLVIPQPTLVHQDYSCNWSCTRFHSSYGRLRHGI